MTRLLKLIVCCLVLPSVAANAQTILSTPYDSHRRGHLLDHDYWHHDFHVAEVDLHVPDVTVLDQQADGLAKIARHLHEDAHKLSQDYEHSEGIEVYVDRVDRLHKHMHDLLHEAAETGTQSSALADHIKRDVKEVRGLLSRLYVELQHQGIDGARTVDYHAMVHMRKIIVEEAFPLIRQMEVTLYGYSPEDHLRSFHHRPLHSGRWIQQRVRIHH